MKRLLIILPAIPRPIVIMHQFAGWCSINSTLPSLAIKLIMQQILIATSNLHKIEEIQAVLQPLGIDCLGLDQLQLDLDEPEEDGNTFAANACIKAVAYATATNHWCLADDSGLEVDALGGAPGIYSARYAEREPLEKDGLELTPTFADPAARDMANNQRLLRELEGVPDDQRNARFICAMCLADATGQVVAETRGTMEGRIIHQPRGSNGFGYDPLLELLEDDGPSSSDRAANRTSAELPPHEKNARSHRGQAARAMAAIIREKL